MPFLFLLATTMYCHAPYNAFSFGTETVYVQFQIIKVNFSLEQNLVLKTNLTYNSQNQEGIILDILCNLIENSVCKTYQKLTLLWVQDWERTILCKSLKQRYWGNVGAIPKRIWAKQIPAAKTKKDGDGEYQFSLLLTDYCGGGAALARARLHT